ncbi:proline-rich receptor-like protein kinase PERK12 [Oncorhynchus mykiss]|uniref:proline-rich receptor-like protein kinase PERK12 n=1 Tax=Oncorhynchus mykiss TaxID=8022 RepID=UPI001878730F|nr:proline-rich receptor-like protein kinase PERK12 [Oncorhynchus mykiss]
MYVQWSPPSLGRSGRSQAESSGQGKPTFPGSVREKPSRVIWPGEAHLPWVSQGEAKQSHLARGSPPSLGRSGRSQAESSGQGKPTFPGSVREKPSRVIWPGEAHLPRVSQGEAKQSHLARGSPPSLGRSGRSQAESSGQGKPTFPGSVREKPSRVIWPGEAHLPRVSQGEAKQSHLARGSPPSLGRSGRSQAESSGQSLHRSPNISKRWIPTSPGEPSSPPALQPSSPLTLQPTPPILQPSNPPALQPSNPSALQPSSPPTLQPSNPPTLQPSNPPALQSSNPQAL